MIKIGGLILNLDEFKRYFNSNIHLFISGISWEERCHYGWKRLIENNFIPEQKIILYYKEVLDKNLVGSKQDSEKYFDDLFNIKSSGSKLFLNIFDEISGCSEFAKFLDSNFKDIKNKTVIIDFSVMIKPYIFILLKYLINIKKVNKILLLYTEPLSYQQPRKKYILEEGEFFTKGTIHTGEIPSYSGIRVLDKKNALIVLMGFEGGRAVEVVNAADPDITIPINGFPAYRPEFKDISILMNEELLREPEIFKNLQYAPANDPFETNNVLNDIYIQFHERYNISIAPIGTKPMAIGSCLFALMFSDCRIIYPYPTEYNLKSSKGCGPTWVYVLNIFEDDK
ncbi:hypothetical protein KJA15_04445 [Patescibacteria group bacterium]|nr:hypothetical protein [Patescibacteria group bacterium]